MKFPCFSRALLNWYDKHGRKDLPWKNPLTPYRVWVSEIMLQQTQVKTVIPYFNRFIERFPDLVTLASSEEDQLFAYWSGLGYYARVRNLKKSAAIILNKYGGVIPNNLSALKTLPGIGPTTAAAICSLAFDLPSAILDGNVIRVLSRYFLIIGVPNERAFQTELWKRANEIMPLVRCGDYTQAIMDLGASCCTKHRPACHQCPLNKGCLAYRYNRVSELPLVKTKKVLPVQEACFALIHNDRGEVYLEKRPSKGIWGGLYCLPTLDNIISENLTPWQTLTHTFTHFKLTMKIYKLKKQSSDYFLPGAWLRAEYAHEVGLPKPIFKLLRTFWDSWDVEIKF